MSHWESGKLVSVDFPSNFWPEIYFYFIAYISVNVPRNRGCNRHDQLDSYQYNKFKYPVLNFGLSHTPHLLRFHVVDCRQAAYQKLFLSFACPEEVTLDKQVNSTYQ